jgi:hypothetical protein
MAPNVDVMRNRDRAKYQNGKRQHYSNVTVTIREPSPNNWIKPCWSVTTGFLLGLVCTQGDVLITGNQETLFTGYRASAGITKTTTW